MLIAGKWYESGTFWSIAGVGATLLVGIITVVVTYLIYAAGKPKRVLYYSANVIADLGSYLPANDNEIQVMRGTQKLSSPHLVQVGLSFVGRSDISSADWDSGRPLKIDLNAPIVSLIDVVYTPRDRSPSRPQISGSALILEPGLISKGQKITVSLLVDGHPSLTLDSPLINVRLSRSLPVLFPLPSPIKVLSYAFALSVLLSVAALLALAHQGTWAAVLILWPELSFVIWFLIFFVRHLAAEKRAR